MDEIIQNIHDKNFKSLIAKLLAAQWLSGVDVTPKTATTKANYTFNFTDKGTFSLATIKLQQEKSPYWDDCQAFLRSLNEQEEAFFYANVMPDHPNKR